MAKLFAAFSSCCLPAAIGLLAIVLGIIFAPFIAAIALIGFTGLVLVNMFVSKE